MVDIGSLGSSFGLGDSPAATKSTSKAQKETVSLGNMTIVMNETFLTKNMFQDGQVVTDDGTKLTPDYYREGRYTTVTNDVGDEFKIWAPAPEQIGGHEGYDRRNLATLRMVRKNKTLIPPYSKFFLEEVIEPHEERYQFVETFGDWYIFFYGERPPIYTFTGLVLNGENYNWLNEFQFFYDSFMRGTRAVQQIGRVNIVYNYQQVTGFMLGKSISFRAVSPLAAAISFKMAVVKRYILSANVEGAFSDSAIQSQETIEALQKQIGKSATSHPYLYESISKIAKNVKDPASMESASVQGVKSYAEMIKANSLQEFGTV